MAIPIGGLDPDEQAVLRAALDDLGLTAEHLAGEAAGRVAALETGAQSIPAAVAEALAAGGQIRKPTYAALAATAGTTGQVGVSIEAAGTHASLAGDVGASGGQTPNGGEFRFVVGTGWVRVGDLQSKIATDAVASIPSVMQPFVDDAQTAAGFTSLAALTTFAVTHMSTGEASRVTSDDTGTHAAVAGEIALGGGAATPGASIPNEGDYVRQSDGSVLRVRDSSRQRTSAQADRAETAANTIQLPNYDSYFAPIVDGTMDANGKVIEGTDYKGRRYAQPAFGWNSAKESAKYRVWIDNGSIKVLNNTTAKITSLVTNAFIRNLRISPDEKSVFYEQFYALGGDWREMHVKIDGSGIPAYAMAQKHIVCPGDSLTAGVGATTGGLYGEQNEARGIYGGSGWARALWVDSAFQAAGIKVWNYGWSGATSTAIADHYVNDLTADKKDWTVLVCFGRNNINPASTVLADFKRVEDACSAFYKRIFFTSVTYRRGNERLVTGTYNRGLVDAINSTMLGYVGADRYVDVLGHIIDPSASGALAQAIAAGAVAGVTAQDTTDFNDGVPPASLMANESPFPSDVHYNDAGYQYGWYPVIKAKLAAAGGYF